MSNPLSAFFQKKVVVKYLLSIVTVALVLFLVGSRQSVQAYEGLLAQLRQGSSSVSGQLPQFENTSVGLSGGPKVDELRIAGFSCDGGTSCRLANNNWCTRWCDAGSLDAEPNDGCNGVWRNGEMGSNGQCNKGDLVRCTPTQKAYRYYCPNGLVNGRCLEGEAPVFGGSVPGGSSQNLDPEMPNKCGAYQFDFSDPASPNNSGNCGAVTYVWPDADCDGSTDTPPGTNTCNSSCTSNAECDADAGQICANTNQGKRCRYEFNQKDPNCTIPACEVVRFSVKKMQNPDQPVTYVYEADKNGNTRLINGSAITKLGLGDQIENVEGRKRVLVEDGDQVRIATRVKSTSPIRSVRYVTTQGGINQDPFGPIYLSPVKHGENTRRIVFSRRASESTTGKRYSQAALRRSRVDYRVDLDRIALQPGQRAKNDVTFRVRVGQNKSTCQAIVRFVAKLPDAPVCNSITLRNLNRPDDTTNTVKVNEMVRFTCGNVNGAVRYEFRVLEPNKKITYLKPVEVQSTTSEPYTVTQDGSFVGQCRPCMGRLSGSCMKWDDDDVSAPTVKFQSVDYQEPQFQDFSAEVRPNVAQ